MDINIKKYKSINLIKLYICITCQNVSQMKKLLKLSGSIPAYTTKKGHCDRDLVKNC